MSQQTVPVSKPALRRFLGHAALRLIISMIGLAILKLWNPLSSPDSTPANLFGLPGFYQGMLKQFARHESVRYTSTIEIDPKEMSTGRFSTSNVCGQRLYLSELISALVDSPKAPRVIAVDKYFGETACAGDPAGKNNTQALQQTFTAAKAKTDIVLGLSIDETAPVEQKWAIDRKLVGWHPNTRPLEPFYRFEDVDHGVVNLAGDSRQLPLEYSVLLPGDVPKIERREGFAWRVAHAYQPDNLPKLRPEFEPTDEAAPYVNFLDPQLLQRSKFSAFAVLCRLAPARAEKLGQDCRLAPQLPANLHLNPIVIIGEKTSEDKHDSPVGTLEGYLIHANYVEALLDSRYFYRVPWLVNMLAMLVMIVVVEIVIYRCTALAWYVPAILLVLLCLFFFIGELLLVQFAHILLAPFISLPSFFAQAVEHFHTRANEWWQKQNPEPAEVPE